MIEDFGQLFPFDRKLEFAAGLEDFIAFRRFSDFGFNVKQTVANFNIGFVGASREEIDLFRHYASCVKGRFAFPHMLLDAGNNVLSKNAEFSTGNDFGCFISTNCFIFVVRICHLIAYLFQVV